MDIFHMSDIIPLIGLPYPSYGRSNYNVPCPCCEDEPHAKLSTSICRRMYFAVRAVGSPAAFSICMHTIRGLPARRSVML